MSLLDQSILDLHELLHKKEISVSDLVDESLKRINDVEDKVKAFITIDEENARSRAKELDGKIGTDSANHPLFGIPAGIKDNIVTKGLRTTAASKMLENFDPIYNATVMEKLNTAGAVTIGKLNMDEFGIGSTTEKSAFHVTRNPWNTETVPGGSSGGSAAAVASGEVLYSLGSDTGGSIRQPAAFCGVVGLKPTYGRVSRSGLVAFASSLDQIGPITRTVKDNALVLAAISGEDPFDTTSMPKEVPDYASTLTGNVKGLKIAVPKEYLGEGISEAAKESVMAALKVLESLGATWEEVSLPHAKYVLPTYYVLASAEASSSMARYDGVRYGYRTPNPKNLEELYKKSRSEAFGDEVKRRIMLGSYTLSSGLYEDYYEKAQKARTLIIKDYEEVFANYDVVIGPTATGAAYKIGEAIDDLDTMNAEGLLSTPANLAGLPAISVPCGFDQGLPLGLQMIGKHFDEQTLYQAAYAYEQATDFHKQKPQL